MKIFPLRTCLVVVAALLPWIASADTHSSSANFTLLPAEPGASGGPIANSGGTITAEISIGDAIAGGVSNVTSGGVQAKAGYTGQLYDTQSLTLTADPPAVVETQTTVLSAVATMDDATLVHLSGNGAVWTAVDGAISGIDSVGLVSTGNVFLNSPATVRGTFDGIDGDLGITVLNLNLESPDDSLPDPTFTDLPFDPAQEGVYQGLLTDGSGNVIGSISALKLSNLGAFTGKVIFNGKKAVLRGSLDAQGNFVGQILRRNMDPLDVVLQIGNTDGGGLAVYGTVSGDGTVGSAHIAQAPYHKRKNPVPEAMVKRYTFIIPGSSAGDPAIPAGDGYGSAKVAVSGVIAAIGKTGDGKPFSSRGFLSSDDQWHFFQPLYRNQGQLAGVLSFRDVPAVSDVDGAMKWVKNPNSKEKSYPDGFDLSASLVGSVFDPPAKGARAMVELADQNYNAALSLVGDTAPDGVVSRVITWPGNNALRYYGPEKLAARANPITGLIGGSYFDPSVPAKIRFGGAVHQKQGLAAGNFLFANQSGYLLIEPGISFAYPGSEEAGPLDLTEIPGGSATGPAVTAIAFDPLAAGNFGGIPSLGGDIAGGLEGVKISPTGAVSGTLWIGGKRHLFKGLIDANGSAAIEIPRKDLASLLVTLQLVKADGTSDGFQLTGSIDVDGDIHDIDAQRRPVYSRTDRAPNEGKYTIAMPAPGAVDIMLEPGGDGYGSLAVSFLGTCKGKLILPDGTRATMAGHVSRNSEWSVHRSLYAARGFLAGKLTFRDVGGVSDVDGTCRWIKQSAVPRTTTYVNGFDSTRTVIGGSYAPPAVGESAFAALEDRNYNAWMRLAGPDLAPAVPADITELDRAVTWNERNKILYYGPDKASIRFSAKTGLATGSYVDKASGARVKFGGALMQEQELVTGSYQSDGQSGVFSISPR